MIQISVTILIFCLAFVPIICVIECPAGQSAQQLMDIQVTSNGCPAHIPEEEDFTYCCDRHDVCYSTCGATKAYCDEDLQKCVQKLCKEVFYMNRKCTSAARSYAQEVVKSAETGEYHYDNYQKKHCTCINEENVPEHKKALVREIFFNERHDSAQADKKTNTIFQKESLVGDKFAIFYYTLIKRYDKNILHVEDRVGKKLRIGKNRPPKESDLNFKKASTSQSQELR